jgi:hypothetical protein
VTIYEKKTKVKSSDKTVLCRLLMRTDISPSHGKYVTPYSCRKKLFPGYSAKQGTLKIIMSGEQTRI